MQRSAVLLFFLCSSLLGSSRPALAAAPNDDGMPAVERRTAMVDMGPNRLLLATGAASFAFAYGGALWPVVRSSRAARITVAPSSAAGGGVALAAATF